MNRTGADEWTTTEPMCSSVVHAPARRKRNRFFSVRRWSNWHHNRAKGVVVVADAPTGQRGSKQALDNGQESVGHSASSSWALTITEESESAPAARTASNKNTRECPICFTRRPAEYFPTLSYCAHRACHFCMVQYLQMQISESRVNISCPECSEPLHPNDIYAMLADRADVIGKYEEFSVRRVLMTDPDTRWCPAPDCGYAVIASSCAACPEIKCQRPGCGASFCYHCKMLWHSNQTCDEARARRRSVIASPIEIDVSVKPSDIKACPRCRTYIVKMNDGSCNHMVCALCGAEFCWLCLKEISDLHYLSPSGCTFWGKKPWSRKKKLFWQVGMLVGAPVGIAVVSSLAVPAITFGFPVWVGRKLHQRIKEANRYKRLGAIASGVFGSVLFSPFLAVLAVSVGVPILLAYIYGVVLVSLCRDGSFGVASHPSNLKLTLDENVLTMTTTGSGGGHREADSSAFEKALLLKDALGEEAVLFGGRAGGQSGQVELDMCDQYAELVGKVDSCCFDKRSIRTLGSIAEASSNQDGASLKVLNGSIAGCSRSTDDAKWSMDTKTAMDSHEGDYSMKRLESRISCFMDEAASLYGVDDEACTLLSRTRTKVGAATSRHSWVSQGDIVPPLTLTSSRPSISCKHKSLSVAGQEDEGTAEFLLLPSDAIITIEKQVNAGARRSGLSRTRSMLGTLLGTFSVSKKGSLSLLGSRSRQSSTCQSDLSAVVSCCSVQPPVVASDTGESVSQSMPNITSPRASF